jgi:hypothetical protein
MGDGRILERGGQDTFLRLTADDISHQFILAELGTRLESQ